MIMRHRQYNYKCVIYGWDSLCAASQDWIQQMGVENLPKKGHQPFYNVLVEDGSTRYAAQGKTVVTIFRKLPEKGEVFFYIMLQDDTSGMCGRLRPLILFQELSIEVEA